MTTTATKRPQQRGVNAALARKRRNRATWIAAAIAAAVVLAAVLALVASGGGDDDSGGTTVDDGTGTTVVLEETRTVAVSGSSLVPFVGVAGDAAVGAPAPQVTGSSFDGTPRSVQPGKPTMVVFLAHWCSHCQAEVPRLVDWYGAGHAPAGLDVIAVATATDEAAPNFPPSGWLEREEWPWPVLVDDGDSSAMAAYGFQTFPAFALLDADGVVRFRVTGEIETAALDAVLLETLGLA